MTYGGTAKLRGGGSMRITFDDVNNWDDLVQVFSNGLVGANVEITAGSWEGTNDHLGPAYHDSNVEIWDGRGEIVSVDPEGLHVEFDDGSSEVYVRYADIEEVKYL